MRREQGRDQVSAWLCVGVLGGVVESLLSDEEVEALRMDRAVLELLVAGAGCIPWASCGCSAATSLRRCLALTQCLSLRSSI
jgi:uncharacterized membrane protein YraQ (UPF0718 family)